MNIYRKKYIFTAWNWAICGTCCPNCDCSGNATLILRCPMTYGHVYQVAAWGRCGAAFGVHPIAAEGEPSGKSLTTLWDLGGLCSSWRLFFGRPDHLWPGWWWLEPWIFFDFPYIYICVYIYTHIGNVISPTDELIFFRGVGMPPTSDDLWRTWISCVFHARRMAAYKVGVRSMCYSRSIYSARKRVGCNLGYLSRLDVSVGAFLNTWGVEFCGWMALDSEDLISMIWPTGSELSFFQCLFPSSPCFFHTNYWRIYIYIYNITYIRINISVYTIYIYIYLVSALV